MDLALELSQQLSHRGLKLVVAESCTGGQISTLCTQKSGSSQWFEGSVVCYSNNLKQRLLKVQSQTLEDFGAVSEQVAQEMSVGALQLLDDGFAVAITGIAGPTGGSEEKPVGTVCFSWSWGQNLTVSKTQLFGGERHEIQATASAFALRGVVEILRSLEEA